MQIETIADTMSTEQKLRPVVITVIAAKLAVFALLMTTIHFQAPDFQTTMPASVEMAAIR